jgi:hypothetical protein
VHREEPGSRETRHGMELKFYMSCNASGMHWMHFAYPMHPNLFPWWDRGLGHVVTMQVCEVGMRETGEKNSSSLVETLSKLRFLWF